MIKQINEFLDPKDRSKLSILIFLIMLLGIVEMLSISLIMPFIALIANPQVVQTNGYLLEIYNFLGLSSVNQFVFIIGLFILLFLLISNSYAALVTLMSLRFSYSQGHLLANRLFKGYMTQPYFFYLTRHSSVLVKNMTTEVNRMITMIINPMFILAKAMCVTIAISLLLFLMDPILALIICAIMGSLYMIFSYTVRKRLMRMGGMATKLRSTQVKCLNEALQGIKDIKLLGKEQSVLDEFEATSSLAATYDTENSIFAALPKYALEVIAFGGILVITLYLLKVKQDISQVLPLISLYAFAGYRLMPLLQNIITNLASIRYSTPVINILQQELESIEKNNHYSSSESINPIYFNKKIQFNHVSYSYPDTDKNIVNDLSLIIEKNTTVGFIGKTGSGKTTTIDLLLGLLTPTAGDVLIDDTPLNINTIRAWQSNIGYVSQHIYLHDTTIAKNIALGIHDEQIDMDKIKYAAKLAHIDDFITNELPQGYQTTVGEKGVRLSGGQRQRIAIARALYHDPQVLVFDEATSALDTVTEEAVMQALDSLNHKKTIILIAHRLSTLKNCDQIFTLGETNT